MRLLDVSKFVIKWPMRKVDESLLDYLRSLPSDVRFELSSFDHYFSNLKWLQKVIGRLCR